DEQRQRRQAQGQFPERRAAPMRLAQVAAPEISLDGGGRQRGRQRKPRQHKLHWREQQQADGESAGEPGGQAAAAHGAAPPKPTSARRRPSARSTRSEEGARPSSSASCPSQPNSAGDATRSNSSAKTPSA